MKALNPPIPSVKRFFHKNAKYVLIVITVVALVASSQTIRFSPIAAFGGAVWVNDGLHYISDTQMAERTRKIEAPVEAKLASAITQATPLCDQVDGGFCQQSAGVYAVKTLTAAAIEYVPAVPDQKVVTGYCTLCGDGTFSPSCAVGRGACSWHNGVAQYNAAKYRVISGKPATQAVPAVFSYEPKTYQDSPNYAKPATPSLDVIVENSK